MSVILLLIVAGGLVAGGFLGAFAWAVRSGQYDDVATPAERMLLDEHPRDFDRPAQTGRFVPQERGQ
jgi:cbb3-type cytochrome oxidase maturation protein